MKTYQERVEISWSLEPAEHRFSPAYIYNQINGGQDRGSSIPDALQLVIDQGVSTLATMHYSDQDFLTQPSKAAKQEAAQYKGKSWKTANGTSEIKSALANRLPVVGGIMVFDSLMNLRGTDSAYNTFNGDFKGGHAITIVGYDDNRYGGAFKIINSWSQNWGDQGYFWMPYSAVNQTVNVPGGQSTVLKYAYVLEDKENTTKPDPDPVKPPPSSELPNLQVSNWTANYDPVPRGSGSLQYLVSNTGNASAPAGANISLVLSRDEKFTASNTYVIYEEIPFDLAPGGGAFRDEGNAIPFNFPDQLEPGEYYMALWVDDRNEVAESNEDDNLSPAQNTINFVNTLPDVEVLSWYSEWNFFGIGMLLYEVINNGASAAPAGWLITLALSPNEVIGDNDEIFLYGEQVAQSLPPGQSLFPQNFLGFYSLYFDYFGNPVPTGVYFMALWVDPDNRLQESNEINNASLSWGTVPIVGVLGLSSATANAPANALEKTGQIPQGKAYNGKILPSRQGSMRKVRISATPQGGRQLELLDNQAVEPSQQVKAGAIHTWSKVTRSRQQVDHLCVDKKSGKRCEVWDYFRGECRLHEEEPQR